MKPELPENFDVGRFEELKPLSLAESAWMAGVTQEAFERFLDAAGLGHLRHIPMTELVRAGFTLLGQREAQLAMFRLQLSASLIREKELAEALHSKLTVDSSEFFIAKPLTKSDTASSQKKTKKKKGKK